MNSPPAITDADLERLDAFLNSDAVPESAMDVSTLEGFLTVNSTFNLTQGNC